MIWRPAPRLVRDPSPAIIGLINPSSRLIWGPARFLIRLPDISIARDVNPMPVAIKVIHAGVIAIGMSPAFGTADHVIALAIPDVPFVSLRRAAYFIFRLISAANTNNLSSMHACTALRRGDFGFAFADDHVRLGIRIHLHAVTSLPQRMHRNIRRIDFHLRLAALHHGVTGVS